MTQMTQAEMQNKLIAKAQAEPEFRSQLVADPKATIEGLSGLELPAAINIEVHEDSATSFHLVLPPSAKLTEDELATVFAGGWGNTAQQFFEEGLYSSYDGGSSAID